MVLVTDSPKRQRRRQKLASDPKERLRLTWRTAAESPCVSCASPPYLSPPAALRFHAELLTPPTWELWEPQKLTPPHRVNNALHWASLDAPSLEEFLLMSHPRLPRKERSPLCPVGTMLDMLVPLSRVGLVQEVTVMPWGLSGRLPYVCVGVACVGWQRVPLCTRAPQLLST